MLFADPEFPKDFCCLGFSLGFSRNEFPPEGAEENGPFDKVADENPTGITEPTSGLDFGPVRPFRSGSSSGLEGVG